MSKIYKPKILIAVPNTGWIRHELCKVLMEWSKQARVEIITPQIRPIDASRNYCVKYFMDNYKNHHDRLWFIDSDIIPHHSFLDKLLAHDKEVVSAACLVTKKAGDKQMIVPTHFKDIGDGKYQNKTGGKGLDTVKITGTGCLMIKRMVLATDISEEWFQFVYDPWTSLVTETEDTFFCKRLSKFNIAIHYDWDCICDHIREVSLAGVHFASRG